MVKFTIEQIRDLADGLDSNMDCYIHKENFKIVILFNRLDADLAGGFEDDYKEIDENFLDYIAIEKLEARDSYKIMEDFVSQIHDPKIYKRFSNALEREGPFRNFRYELNDHLEIKKAWYIFKNKQIREYVRRELKITFPNAVIEEEEVTEKKDVPISFHNKTFALISNTENGEVSSETTFEFSQEGDLVTAEYFGGSVLYGKIIAILKENQLHMMYQSVSNDHALDAGKAIADIELDETGKIKLFLRWEWLKGSGDLGTSSYIEQ